MSDIQKLQTQANVIKHVIQVKMNLAKPLFVSLLQPWQSPAAPLFNNGVHMGPDHRSYGGPIQQPYGVPTQQPSCQPAWQVAPNAPAERPADKPSTTVEMIQDRLVQEMLEEFSRERGYEFALLQNGFVVDYMQDESSERRVLVVPYSTLNFSGRVVTEAVGFAFTPAKERHYHMDDQMPAYPWGHPSMARAEEEEDKSDIDE